MEDRSTPEHRQKIDNLLKVKREELAVHEKAMPVEVAEAENDPIKQKEIADVAAAIEAAKKELNECEQQILEATQEQGRRSSLFRLPTGCLLGWKTSIVSCRPFLMKVRLTSQA